MVDRSSAPGSEISVAGYPIQIQTGALHLLGQTARRIAPAHRYALITDTNVGALYSPRALESLGIERSFEFRISPGEASKNRHQWARLTDEMLAAGFGRDSAIIAVGGGVVGDLAGFVAATYMRGVPVVQVPTSLLAMIDSSIGGKTGVDTAAGKNLVGAFHPPAGVLIDPTVLATLPVEELRSGFAEAVKHGAMADSSYFSFLSRLAPRLAEAAQRDPAAMQGVIETSVGIKAGVVASDERERGMRKTLNFGHTIGHAIEHLSRYSLRHGEAVGIGMVAEARAGELAGHAAAGTADAIATVLAAASLPTRRPLAMDPDSILAAMRGDKKTVAGTIEYAIPSSIGVAASRDAGFTVRLPDSAILEALA